MRVDFNFNFHILPFFGVKRDVPAKTKPYLTDTLSTDVFERQKRPEDNIEYSALVDIEELSKKDKHFLSRLDCFRKNRALYLMSKGTPPACAIRFAKLDEAHYERANRLLDININAPDAEKIIPFATDRFNRLTSMFGEDIPLDSAIAISKFKDASFEKNKTLAVAGFSPMQANSILSKGNNFYQKIKKLLDLGVNSQDIFEIYASGEDVIEYYNSSIKFGQNPKIASGLFYIADDKKGKAYSILKKFEDFISPKEEVTSIFRSFFEKMTDGEVDDFVSYVQKLDIDGLKKNLPEGYNLSSILTFANYHQKSGKTHFTKQDLTFNQDLTTYLSENFLNADGLSDLLAIFPCTQREVGLFPKGWLKNAKNNEIAKKKVYEAIYKFQKSKKTDELEDALKEALNTNVKITPLESGCVGRGYKIAVDGAIDVCLKIFHDIKQMEMEPNEHGKTIEPQTALFANKHSSKFVKMYFGRVASKTDKNAFIVTQYIDSKISPVSKKLENETRIEMIAEDADSSHNMANGRIFDFGFVTIKDSDGKKLDGTFKN